MLRDKNTIFISQLLRNSGRVVIIETEGLTIGNYIYAERQKSREAKAFSRFVGQLNAFLKANSPQF